MSRFIMKYTNKLHSNIEIIWDWCCKPEVIKIKVYQPDSNMIKSIKTFKLTDNLDFLK